MKCLITGAANGIGYALAKKFLHAGYEVVGIDVDRERGNQIQYEFGDRFEYIYMNLSRVDDFSHLSHMLQGNPIDVLIHNAGINCVGSFSRSRFGVQESVMAVGFSAPILITNQLLRESLVNSGGTIAFVSSLAHFVSYPGAAVYAASKDGLTSYARSLAIEVAPQKIHVLTVFPGPTDTKHAQKYSPSPNAKSRRMSPDLLATKVFSAIVRRKRTLIPGVANKVSAKIGRYLPKVSEYMMKKAIYERLGDQRIENEKVD